MMMSDIEGRNKKCLRKDDRRELGGVGISTVNAVRRGGAGRTSKGPDAGKGSGSFEESRGPPFRDHEGNRAGACFEESLAVDTGNKVFGEGFHFAVVRKTGQGPAKTLLSKGLRALAIRLRGIQMAIGIGSPRGTR